MSGLGTHRRLTRELYEGSRLCRVCLAEDGVNWTYMSPGSGHQDTGVNGTNGTRTATKSAYSNASHFFSNNNKESSDDEEIGGNVPYFEVIAVTEQVEAIARSSSRSLNGSKRSASVHPLFVLQKEACDKLDSNCAASTSSGATAGNGHREPVRILSDSKYVDNSEGSFTIHYIKHYSGDILGTASVTFQGPVRLNREFAKCLRDRMTISQNRPKHFLAFVSPKSGKNRGVKIFRNKVRPIFELAGIKITEMITERERHSIEYLQKCDLSDFDGIISVGGDGMYSEVMNGLVLRTQKDAGVDHNTPDARIKPCDIPIGIIPAGSGDVLCMFLYGTRDPETCALHIIKGFQKSTNIYSVHYGHQLACYCGLILGFGFSGYLMRSSNKHRWIGPARYTVMILIYMLKHAFYRMNVRYLPANGSREESRTSGNCTPIADDVKWANLMGDFHSIDTWAVTLAKNGEILEPYFGDTSSTVIMLNKCGRLEHLKYLAQLANLKSACYDNNCVKLARTTKFNIHFHQAPKKGNGSKVNQNDTSNGLPPKTYLNCDGNPIKVHSSDFSIRVLQNVVSLFGREKEVTETKL